MSSDAEKENFDSRLAQRLRSVAVVGYDKNVPNCAGVAKLARVAAHAAGAAKVDARVLLVVPRSAPDAETLWARVAARPAGDAALHAHGDGGPGGARAVFERFVGLCEDATTGGRLGSPRYPALSRPTRLAARDDAEAALARSRAPSRARRCARSATTRSMATPKPMTAVAPSSRRLVAELAAALKSTAGDGENGDEAGGAQLAQHRGSYVGARLLDAPHLHVTLVPPCVATESNGGSAGDGAGARARARCARSARPRAGASRCASKYTRAPARAAAGSACGRSARSRASASEGHPEQQAVYHVTDTAALAGGAVARHARDADRRDQGRAARRDRSPRRARGASSSRDCALSLDAEVHGPSATAVAPELERPPCRPIIGSRGLLNRSRCIPSGSATLDAKSVRPPPTSSRSQRSPPAPSRAASTSASSSRQSRRAHQSSSAAQC